MKALLYLLICATAWAQYPYEKGKAAAREAWSDSEQGYYPDGRVIVIVGGKNNEELVYYTNKTEWTSESVDTYLNPPNIRKLRNLGFKKLTFADELTPKKPRIFASFDLDPKKKR